MKRTKSYYELFYLARICELETEAKQLEDSGDIVGHEETMNEIQRLEHSLAVIQKEAA